MELLLVSIISGIFAVISLIILHFSWKSKIMITQEIEQIRAEKELKIAKYKRPAKPKRLPKGYQNQLTDLVEIIGKVEPETLNKVVDLLQGNETGTDNKLIETLLPLASNFLQGMSENTEYKQEQLPTFS